MRVIAGVKKGRNLQYPKTADVRPLTDRIKEALFSIISECIPGSFVLDLYAGSGSFGIEALSRGAANVFFVEKDLRAINIIRKNIEALELDGSSQVITGEVFPLNKKICTHKNRFSIIFMDPPFGMVESSIFSSRILEHVGELKRILNKKGVLIIRIPAHIDGLPMLNGLVEIKSKEYGRSKLVFFRKGET